MTQYGPQEVDAILRRALELQGGRSNALSEQELFAAAQELDVSPDAVRQAIAETQAQAELSRGVAELRAQRKRRLLSLFGTWSVLLLALTAIDYTTGPGWWVQWPALVLGTILLFRAHATLNPSDEADEKAALRALEKRRREERKRDAILNDKPGEFRELAERGAKALLTIAVDALDDATQQGRGRRGQQKRWRYQGEPTRGAAPSAEVADDEANPVHTPRARKL